MMGLFDKLFSKAKDNPQNHWAHIALAISKDFENIRVDLYDVCKEALIEFAKKDNSVIRTNSYSDNVQGLNIKVFQLVLSSLLIGMKKYIPPHQGNRFADLLWRQVLGTQFLSAVKRGKVLFERSDTFPKMFTFFGYVGEDITGKVNPAEAML